MMLLLAAFPLFALAQNQPQTPSQPSAQGAAPQYQRAAEPPTMVNVGGGGYGYGYGNNYGAGTTAAGSAMTGMGNAIRSAGDYNLSTSQAAVNMSQAESMQIQNQQQYTDTYFQMRATNKAARDAEKGPGLTMEQITKIAHEGVPKPMSPSEMDATTGALSWPGPLQEDTFASQRAIVDALMSKHATYGFLNYADQMEVRKEVDAMTGALKKQIRQMPTTDYVEAKTFLTSVAYAATKPSA
jgi:hypothetical protein